MTPEVKAQAEKALDRYSKMISGNTEIEFPDAIAHKREQDALSKHAKQTQPTFVEDLHRTEADAFRHALENAADDIRPGLGGDYYLLNKDYSQLAAAQKGFKRAANRTGPTLSNITRS